MKARVVIGANFGDEGKGLVTDYLCSQGAGMVVRFNGGAQAGHTVVTPYGHRHVFQHFGSGTFLRVPTYLSQFFVCNPLLFLREYEALRLMGLWPIVYAHPTCVVTTFADMIINQRLEDSRGINRHGSVGVGINETINRSEIPELRITVADLWNGVNLEGKLKEICSRYAEFRTGSPIEDVDDMVKAFCKFAVEFAGYVHPLGIAQCRDQNMVFEGAQGLLLDQDNKEYFPHVTRSKTGMHNVRILCDQAGIKEEDLEVYYVSRTYLTRHGAGLLPGETNALKFQDDTNTDHPYQGRLRFAPLDAGLVARCSKDRGSDNYRLVMTHCDQVPTTAGDIQVNGPTRADVTDFRTIKAIET